MIRGRSVKSALFPLHKLKSPYIRQFLSLSSDVLDYKDKQENTK